MSGLKDFFEKLILKRNPQTTKKHAKFYPACNKLLSWKVWQKNYENQQVIGLWSPEIAVMDGAFLSVSDAICEQRGTDLHALPCSLIWTVSVHWHIFQYPMILSESNVGHYQPAWMCRLFRACVVHKLHKGSFSELCIMLSLLFNSEFMNTQMRHFFWPTKNWYFLTSPNKPLLWHFKGMELHSENPSLAEHDMPCLSNSVDPDQLASVEANSSESALFVIKYVNSYQKPGSSNLIGWKLEVGVAS